jgi:CHAT domain-containing protein
MRDWSAISTVALAACVVTLLSLAGPICHAGRATRRYIARQRVLNAANRPELLGVRLSSPNRIKLGTAERPEIAAADVIDLSGGEQTPQTSHDEAIACLLLHRPAEAARDLRKAALREPTAQRWSDLAAAELLLARSTGNNEHLLDALVALDHSFDLEPRLPEALYNSAIAMEQLGLRRVAAQRWRLFLGQEKNSMWSAEATRRLKANLQLRTDADDWRRIAKSLPALPKDELVRATEHYPQQARRTAEGPLLTDWAAAIEAHDEPAAKRNRDTALIIGDTLLRHSRDALVADSVAAINQTSVANRRRLVDAHLAYRSGRLALRDMKTSAATQAFDDAAHLFAKSASPMAGVAALYAAVALRNENKTVEARDRLARLVRATNSVRYPSLVAQARYELSLCYGAEGRWRESLENAEMAASLFRQLGERENAAAVGVVLIGVSDLTGQRSEAIEQMLRTFRELSSAGADDRIAATLAAAGHEEVRGHRWDIAHALANIESDLPETRGNPLLKTDNLIRLAAIELNLGNVTRAESAIAAAAAAAQPVSGQTRAKILADIDAVGGAVARRHDPARAVKLLRRSISFQYDSGRSYALPELYLECGRARKAIGDLTGAAADYESGIAVLEHQRTQAAEAWRRIGIFDNATELFDEATKIALERHDVERAFLQVERHRARVLLDELVADQGRIPGILDVKRLGALLRPEAIVVEYYRLDSSIIAFVMDAHNLQVHRLAADSSAIEAQMRAATEALAGRHEARAHLTNLHTMLLEPIRQSLDNRQLLIIVPDPCIQQVPFAALFDPKRQRYRIEQQTVVVAPSMAAFVFSRRKSPRIHQRSVAAFGNPTLDQASDTLLPPLPNAEIEASRVAQTYGRGTATVGAKATKVAFIAALRTPVGVHFAGHARSTPRQPWRSALLFSSGSLTALEIVEVKGVTADIVVLAACSTGRGGNTAVEGSPVLAHAFLIAGVPTVIATLWDVEDSDTRPLMLVLHRRLAVGLAPATALRDAQLAMLHDRHPENREPSRWAAFEVFGAP